MTSIYNKHVKYKNHMRTLRISFDPGIVQEWLVSGQNYICFPKQITQVFKHLCNHLREAAKKTVTDRSRD